MTNSTLHDLVTTIGIDLGKNSFHLIGMDKHGKMLWRQKLARGQLEERLANRPPCRIGLEACAGAHHVGRRLAALGHGWKRRFQPPHPGAAREAVPERPQERLS